MDETGDNFVRLLGNCYYIVFFLLAHFAEIPLFGGMGVLEWLTPEAIGWRREGWEAQGALGSRLGGREAIRSRGGKHTRYKAKGTPVQ